MNEQNTTGRELVKGGESVLGHVSAIVAGVIFMIAGIAMGVSLVLLPLAIPMGFAGLALFLWGLFGYSQKK